MSQAIITQIFGKRGSGKTVKSRNLTATCERVLYYDTLGKDYSDGVTFYDLAELKKFWSQVVAGRFRLIYRPRDPMADFAEVCKLVYHARNMMFVVEECDLYFKAGECGPEFKDLIQRGRKEGIDMVCVTQRPKGFGRLLTSQTDEFYVFRCKEPTDLEYYRERLGVEIAEQLPNLEQYQYLHYDERTNQAQIDQDPWP